MEIAITMPGIGLTILVLAYIWKSNGELQVKMMKALEKIETGQEKGFLMLAKMLENQTKILEKIEGRL